MYKINVFVLTNKKRKVSVKCPQSTLFQLISETGRKSIHGLDVHDSPALMMEEIITAAG